MGFWCAVLRGGVSNSQITAFSNSRTQREYIDCQAVAKGLKNLKVITGDVVDYEFEASSFGHVVSVEVFEHMKNHGLLMAKGGRAGSCSCTFSAINRRHTISEMTG